MILSGKIFPEDLLMGRLAKYPSKVSPANENGTFAGIETTTASEKITDHNHRGEATGMAIAIETAKTTARLAMTTVAEVRAQIAEEVVLQTLQDHRAGKSFWKDYRWI